MRAVLFDSSIYITALRMEDEAIVTVRRMLPDSFVWLSAVVLEELYAGARARDRRIVERLEHDFDRARRILVPSLGDWSQTGRLLARIAAEKNYERIGQARLTNDALIATSAARQGITVITSNAGDFGLLARHCPFKWEMLSSQSG